MKTVFNNPRFLVLYALWVLGHTYLLATNSIPSNADFWPFTGRSHNYSYDLSEWLVYIFSPLIIVGFYNSFCNTTHEE